MGDGNGVTIEPFNEGHEGRRRWKPLEINSKRTRGQTDESMNKGPSNRDNEKERERIRESGTSTNLYQC